MIDARGRVVTPGFADSHCHVPWIGGLTSLMCTDLFSFEDAEQMKEVVEQTAAAG